MAAFLVRVHGKNKSESVLCDGCTNERLAANTDVVFELDELGEADLVALKFRECEACDCRLNSDRAV